MRNKYKLIIAASILAALTGCAKVPAGYKGVIVNLYGSDKGVSEDTVGVGRYFLGPNKELYLFPTFLQNFTWIKEEVITMQTSEGLSISTEAGITYQIKPENVVKVFQKYRLGIEEITNTFLRNMVRDAMNQVASTMTVEQIYGSRKETFIKTVNERVKQEALASGIDVDKIYLIGTFNLPPTVEASINSKIQATQNAMRVENEVATATAEAQKLLISSTAQAKANKIVADSITPEYIEYAAILKWDGKLPTVTSGAVPFVSVPNVK